MNKNSSFPLRLRAAIGAGTIFGLLVGLTSGLSLAAYIIIDNPFLCILLVNHVAAY